MARAWILHKKRKMCTAWHGESRILTSHLPVLFKKHGWQSMPECFFCQQLILFWLVFDAMLLSG